MPSASDIKAGQAFIELYTKNSKLYRGLRNAQRRIGAFSASVTGMGKKVAGMGTMITTPLVAAVKYFANVGDTLDKMSLRTGISVESLSELSFAAEQGGSDLASFEKTIQRMQQSLYGASQGMKAPADALSDLGLEATALMTLDPEAQFMAIADAMDKMEDPTKKTGVAMALLGRAGRQMIPMMTGLRDIRRQAKDLGLTITTEDAKKAAEFTDKLNVLSRVLKMSLFAAGASVADVIAKAIDRIAKIAKITASWIRKNQGLIVSAFKIGAILMAVGGVLMAVGVAGTVLAGIVGGLATALSLAGTVLSGMLGILGFLISPIGLVMVALAGLAAYFLYSSGAGASALEWLGERFAVLKDFALEAFGAIRNAMAAGDMAAAGAVLWSALKLQWVKGLGWLREQWAKWKSFFVSVWTEAVFDLAGIFVTATAEIQKLWWKLVDGIVDAWKGAEKLIAKGVGWIIAKVNGLSAVDVIATIEEGYRRKTGGRQARTDERLAGIDSRKSGIMGTLEEDRQRRMNDIFKRRDREIEAAGSGLAEAQDAYDRAIANAHDAKRKADKGKAAEQGGDGEGGLPGLPGAAAGLAKTATAGSLAFYQGVASHGDPALQIHKQNLAVAKKIERNTAKIKNQEVKLVTFPGGG